MLTAEIAVKTKDFDLLSRKMLDVNSKNETGLHVFQIRLTQEREEDSKTHAELQKMYDQLDRVEKFGYTYFHSMIEKQKEIKTQRKHISELEEQVKTLTTRKHPVLHPGSAVRDLHSPPLVRRSMGQPSFRGLLSTLVRGSPEQFS